MELALGVLFVAALVAFAVYKSASAGPPAPNPHLTCPHCQSKGTVVAAHVTRKRGISGGKATGALLTGGASMLAVGLSRKQGFTHMRCQNCGTVWDVA